MTFEPEGPFIEYEGGAVFIRRCSKCNLFVKADALIHTNDETGLAPGPNANCSRCGRVEMLFQGFM